MTVLVYGITERSEARIEGPGLDRRPLRGVDGGPLVAIVSDHDETPGRTVETFWEYEHTVERLAERHPVVPARFGGVLDDDDAVLAMLHSKHDQLLAALCRTRGAVELALSATWQQPPEPESHTGSSYMQTRLELRRRAREVAAELAPLAAVSRTWRCELPARPGQHLRCAYLVDREQVQDFTALLEQLDHKLEGVDLVCTGPWPPYSFAEEVDE